MEQKLERNRELYLEGEQTKQRYQQIRESTKAAMDSIYVPELDDAKEASKILSDLGSL